MKKFVFLIMTVLLSTLSSIADNRIIVDELMNDNNDLGDAISNAIEQKSKTVGSACVEFTKGKTYTFSRSIVLRDNTTLEGNSCTIRFNTEESTHAMYLYNSFITNRICKSADGTINNFTRTLYARKNITIRNINFECEGGNQFWFNVNSERGIIALSGIDGLKIENCTFNGVYRNTPIWMGDMRNVEIAYCTFTESVAAKGQKGSCGGIWTNLGSYLDSISIHDNTFTNYRDESLSIFCDGKEQQRYFDHVSIYKNVFNSRYYAITIGSCETPGCVKIYDNTFNDFDCKTSPVALELGNSLRSLSLDGNEFLRKDSHSVIDVVAKVALDSFIFKGNHIVNGNIMYSYLPTVRRHCTIKSNVFDKAQNILSLTAACPVIIEKNTFNIRNAKNSYLLNINNGSERDIVRDNSFSIINSDSVMLQQPYGYGYTKVDNRLTFEGNSLRFKNSKTSFFRNNERGKTISMSIFNNNIKGCKLSTLRRDLNTNCVWK